MSWIIKDLWKQLEDSRKHYEPLLADSDGRLQAYWIINRVASNIGERWGVTLQVNFPPGQSLSDAAGLGHRDITLLVHRDRKKFQGVTEDELRTCFHQLKPLAFESVGFGHEGFKVRLPCGRIDCLPSGVHLWCEITPGVLQVLDWLFEHAYQIEGAQAVPK